MQVKGIRCANSPPIYESQAFRNAAVTKKRRGWGMMGKKKGLQRGTYRWAFLDDAR